MRNKTAVLALSIVTLLPINLFAGPIPYPNIGQIAPTTTITATETGDIIGYFVQASAANSDTVRMVDVTTGTTSAWFFPNQTTAVGTSADFGFVSYGDTLVFEIDDLGINQVFASNPADSADGVNHGYVTNFSGGTLYGQALPNGIYVGMEDLNASNSDFDYNDDTFLFTNDASKGSSFDKTSNFSTSTSPVSSDDTPEVPEPSTLILLSTGLFAFAGALRHRSNHQK
jgi:PEP-CTERM motif